jgi:HPt (histidine-containing phosphotransfer) domain-containing protein
MNLKDLAESIGLEEAEFVEMTQVFLEVTESDLKKLESGLQGGNVQRVVEAAHSLKGGAASFGFRDMYEIAREIESRARQGNLEGLAVDMASIREQMLNLARAMAAPRQGV